MSRPYRELNKQELIGLAAARGIELSHMNHRPHILRELYRADQASEAKGSDRDDLLRRMGWLLGKDEVDLPDPAEWPAVGIVVPVYNAPDLLKRCLEGIKRTKYRGELHVQFVDNASWDALTVRQLKAHKVICFDKPVGFSEAVNAGLRALPAACVYHILYNQDIAVTDPAWLDHLIRWMEAHPECGACGPKLLREDGTIDNAGIEMTPHDDCAERGRGCAADDPRFNDYRIVPTFAGALFCVRASVEDRLGLLDERYTFGCEDLVYGMRIAAEAGLQCWYVPTAELTHTCHAIREANPQDKQRIHDWWKASSRLYKAEWGAYCQAIAKPMHIAFILPNFHSACGGARVVAALARYLSGCGVMAEVFYRKKEDDPDSDFPAFPARPLSELREAEIVIATRCDTLADALRVKAGRRLYFVQQIEDCMSRGFGFSQKQALDTYRDTRFEIVTIAPHLADTLRGMGRKSTVCDVGFYRDLYPVVEKSGKPKKLLMYGQTGHKGPDNEAIARLLKSAGFTVNCVHRYAPRAAWADEHFRPKTTAEMAAIYAAHDIYAYASESDGFAMTPIEAMACGTPVVLSEFPGCEQYAEDGVNCLMARYRDPAHIAERVIELSRDAKLRARLVKGGLETAERYDWSNVGRQYARLLLGHTYDRGQPNSRTAGHRMVSGISRNA